VSLEAWSYNYGTSKRILEAVRQSIDGIPGTWGDGSCVIMSSVSGAESDEAIPPQAATDQWIYKASIDYGVKYRVAIPTLT
jgi:hypothetical protein